MYIQKMWNLPTDPLKMPWQLYIYLFLLIHSLFSLLNNVDRSASMCQSIQHFFPIFRITDNLGSQYSFQCRCYTSVQFSWKGQNIRGRALYADSAHCRAPQTWTARCSRWPFGAQRCCSRRKVHRWVCCCTRPGHTWALGGRSWNL